MFFSEYIFVLTFTNYKYIIRLVQDLDYAFVNILTMFRRRIRSRKNLPEGLIASGILYIKVECSYYDIH